MDSFQQADKLTAKEASRRLDINTRDHVEKVEKLLERYVAAWHGIAEMESRCLRDTVGAFRLLEQADANDHPLLSASQARQLAEHDLKRSWARKAAVERLKKLAARRHQEFLDGYRASLGYLMHTAQRIDGSRWAKENPFTATV